jgi:hypothetical protein
MPSLNAIKRFLYWKYQGQNLTFDQMYRLQMEEDDLSLNRSFKRIIKKVKKTMYRRPGDPSGQRKYNSIPRPIPIEARKYE